MTSGFSIFPPALRARIAGAVMRLPGTGEGVARLVEVSMVKVDMAAPLTAVAGNSQSRAAHRPPTIREPPRPPAAVPPAIANPALAKQRGRTE